MKRVILLSDLLGWITHSRSMGPYVLGSHLEDAGYEVIIIDWFTRHPNFLEYLENFLTKDTIAIGISTTFLSLFNREEGGRPLARSDLIRNYEEKDCLWFTEADQLSEWFSSLRETLNKHTHFCKIILGGRKADMLYKLPESEKIANIYKEVDFAFVRYSELTLVELLDQFTKKKVGYQLNMNMQKKNGMHFILNRNITDFCPVTKFNPKWAVMEKEGLPIEVARGCAFNCKFCYYDKKRSYRKPTNNLYQELVRNYEMFGTDSYVFRDDCFNDNRPKVMEVCETILSLPFKIRWVSYARVDLAIKFPETFDIMVKSGGSGFCWGIESLNYDALRKSGKGVHPDKVKEFLTTSYEKYKAECMFHATFVVGLPGETVETQMETVEWFIKNKCLDSATWGMLDFPDQDIAYDEVVRDIPDYVLDPEKYGYSAMGAKYWKHETMDSETAYELCNKVNEKYLAGGGSNFAIMWLVPRWLSLGMTWWQIRSVANSALAANEMRHYAKKLEEEWLPKYFTKLIENNPK